MPLDSGIDLPIDQAPDIAMAAAVAVVISGRDWDYVFGSPVVNITLSDSVISALATEYVHVQVTTTDVITGATQDPTVDSVYMAFTTAPPQLTDFVPATWINRTVDNSVWVRTLVGPSGSPVLTGGVVTVWVKIGDVAEIVVKSVGVLTVV